MSYGPSLPDLYRDAAPYVDKILEAGSRQTFQSNQKFSFIINLKAAKALGLTIPPTLLARADELIE